MRKIIFPVFLLLMNYGIIYSQLNIGGKPISIQQNLNSDNIEIKTMPYFDEQSLIDEDRENQRLKSQAFRFAKSFDVNFSLSNSGSWDNLPDGSRIWRLGIISSGAYSINIIFKEFFLPEGAKLYIFNNDRTHCIGAYTHLNNNVNNVLATEPVAGDFIIIEYSEPAETNRKVKLSIGKVSHDYKGIFGLLNEKDEHFGASGLCNVDINCPEGNDWQNIKHSVTRIIINGSMLCSGALINNTRQDATPYYLTANHCINTQANATVSVFYFNYESPVCNGFDGSVSQTISGSQLIATAPNSSLDFSLLELNDDVPISFNPYFAGWNRDMAPSLNTTCIHHPGGDVKKITIDEDAPVTGDYGSTYDNNSHWLILDWELGTTEGGSSGSPLFDENRRIIGNLTGGEANCENPVNDYYAKFSRSWDDYSENDEQLKYWLDPDNTGIVVLNGYFPNSGGVIGECDSITNFSGTLTLYPTIQDMYVSGNNEYGDLAKAEYFESVGEEEIITGALFYFGVAEGSESNLTFAVLEDQDNKPGTQVASITKPLSEIVEDVNNYEMTYVEFASPVNVSGAFYIVVYLPTIEDEVVAIYTNSTQQAEINTGWEMLSNGEWFQYTETWPIKLNHAIYPIICTYVDVEMPENEKFSINIYPNPFFDDIIIELTEVERINRITIYNYLGSTIRDFTFSSGTGLNKQEINLSHLNPGIYFINVQTKDAHVVKKVIKN